MMFMSTGHSDEVTVPIGVTITAILLPHTVDAGKTAYAGVSPRF